VSLPVRAAAAGIARLAELLVFPSFCKICHEPLDRPGERIVCGACLSGLEPRRGPLCPLCGRFEDGPGEDHLCRRCLARLPTFSRHRSCGVYGGTLKEVVLLFKYRKYAPLSRPLARFASSRIGDDAALWEGVEYLVPVPLHPARQRVRGFNQARLLARDLARPRGLPVLRGTLVKVRNAPAQAGSKAVDRERNVRGVYAVKRPERVRGRTLLLVDDVTTTGATVRECARVLMAAGAKDVRAVTIAQA
jgi:competence protein ComFC